MICSFLIHCYKEFMIFDLSPFESSFYYFIISYNTFMLLKDINRWSVSDTDNTVVSFQALDHFFSK